MIFLQCDAAHAFMVKFSPFLPIHHDGEHETGFDGTSAAGSA